VCHYNRSAVDGILEAVGEKLDVLIINVEEDTVVRNREIDITLLGGAMEPPLPPPQFAPTLRLPKSTKTVRPQWMDESTVRIMSRPATGVRNSVGVDAIGEFEDVESVDNHDGDYVEVANVLPGCFLQLTSSLLKTVSARRKLSVNFDITNLDIVEVRHYVADPYRATSISNVLPLPGAINAWWSAVPYPYTSRIVPPRAKKHYATRHDAHASVRRFQY
jgi:hypothetical protein